MTWLAPASNEVEVVEVVSAAEVSEIGKARPAKVFVHADYKKQLWAERVRFRENTAGRKDPYWHCSGDNHAFDCEAEQVVIALMAGVFVGLESEEQLEAAAKAEAEAEAKMAAEAKGDGDKA